MSARELIPQSDISAILIQQALDERALRILTDGHKHDDRATQWAFRRNPFVARLSQAELRLGRYEVHRS
jgi:hypothetical protein